MSPKSYQTAIDTQI